MAISSTNQAIHTMQSIATDLERLSQYYPKAVFDYLKREPGLSYFYANYTDLAGYQHTLQNRSFTQQHREVLQAALTGQYGNLLDNEESHPVKENINALLQPNTYTVTTGQQIHIYLGPLYVYYKILSTIAKCRWLAENIKDTRFVPVFWMATEDHDFEEISHLKLYNKEFKWPQPEGYTGAVGRLNPLSINELEKELVPVIENDEEAKNLLALFTEAYNTQPTLAAATRYVLHKLFAHTGLVIIDADDTALKKLFIPYIEKDIFSGENTAAVIATTEKLEENYKAQIHPRDINFFYLTDNRRDRIIEEDGRYKVLDTDIEFTKEELITEINNHPEKFSPNVIMRPLYQEVILPNLSYIGGPAEVNYWLQLKDMFGLNGVQFPIIELRKSVITLHGKAMEKAAALGLEVTDFLDTQEDISAAFLAKNDTQGPLDLSVYYQQIEAELETIKSKALEEDPNLKPFLEGEFKKITDTFDKLTAKLEKTAKQKFDTQLKQIEAVKSKFFTPGKLAEREETLLNHPFFTFKNTVDEMLKTLNTHKSPLIIIIPPLK